MATSRSTPNFKTISRLEVPHGRNGKHKEIVSAILCDLDQLKDGSALKVPLKDLGDTKENVRTAWSQPQPMNNFCMSGIRSSGEPSLAQDDKVG